LRVLSSTADEEGVGEVAEQGDDDDPQTDAEELDRAQAMISRTAARGRLTSRAQSRYRRAAGQPPSGAGRPARPPRHRPYEWRLRQIMAEHEMFQTSDLVPLLAERGVSLSREQAYRLVTQPPQRMSMDTLVALCDIFGCTPNDLIKPTVVNVQVRKTASGETDPLPLKERRTTIRRPGQL
jgi:DNA-binding Xre family transcriptional regulator